MSFINPANLWRTGSVLAATGIACGAFGAHGLRSRATPDQIGAWSTASTYSILNGIALLAISSHPRFAHHRFAGPAIAAGTAMFSWSIWALVLNKETFKPLGPITPIGGSIMIAGYIALAF